MKCELCSKRIGKKDHDAAILRLSTTDGVSDLTICKVCAMILDRAADIMRKSGTQSADVTPKWRFKETRAIDKSKVINEKNERDELDPTAE